MILKIICLISFTVICVNCMANGNNVRSMRITDICGRYNNHRVYLELDEKGVLKAENVTYNEADMATYVFKSINASIKADSVVPRECNIEFVSCPACTIKVSLRSSSFSSHCTKENDDHILVFEPPYDIATSGRRLCLRNITHQSQTRSLSIQFVYRKNYTSAFVLDYISERNQKQIISNPYHTTYMSGLHLKTIGSPFFPVFYPRDYAIEHILNCTVATCRVHILFTDFQISPSSSMEFYDSNGENIDIVTGLEARPKPIFSTGSSMTIRFYANGGTGIGYFADVRFLSEDISHDPILKPNTDCGGTVDTFGGAITMMKMLSNESEPKLFDCVWLIRPPSTYMHIKTHLMLRVDAFENMAGASELIVKQGLTSDKPEIEKVVYPAHNFNGTSVIVPLSTGFYVRLRGVFGAKSRLAVVYTVFSYMNCFMGSEFLCENHRCIPIQLHCDGFDHCGDKSDEPETCTLEWASEPIDRRWYVNTPNYYFPKIDRYPDLKTATMIFILSSVGLLSLIFSLIVLIYKTSARAQEQRDLQNQLQTISDLLDSNNIRNDEPIDDPPTYEAPPEYDEVIKIGMEDEINRSRCIRQSGRKSRLRMNKPVNDDLNQTSEDGSYHNQILEVTLPPEELPSPTASLTVSEQEHALNVIALRDQLESSEVFSRISRIGSDLSDRSSSYAYAEENSSQQNHSPPPPYTSNHQSHWLLPTIAKQSDTDVSGYSEALPSRCGEGNLNLSISLSMSPLESIENLSDSNSYVTKNIQSCQKHWLILRRNDPNFTSSLDYENIPSIENQSPYQATHSSVPENMSSIMSPLISNRYPCTSFPSESSHSILSENSKLDFITKNCPICAKFLSLNQPKTKICINCGGSTFLPEITTKICDASTYSSTNPNTKKCQCFPHKSQLILASESASSTILPKTDQLMTFQREVDVPQIAKSHTGIPEQVEASIEGELNGMNRTESGF